MDQSQFEFLKIKKENEELKKKLQEMEEKMKATNLANKPETSPQPPTSPIPPPGFGIISYPPLPQINEIPPYSPTYEPPPPYAPPSSHENVGAISNANANEVVASVPSAPPIERTEMKNYEEFLQIGVVEFTAQNSPIGPTTTEIPFSILASGENGSKYFKRRLNFPSSFKETPKVLVFLSGFDVAVNDDHRINVNVENPDEKGFTLVISSWGKTIIKQVVVSWFAYVDSINKSLRLLESGRQQFKRGENNWNLTGALGDRTYHFGLKFNPPFASHAPSVFASFSLLDVLNIDDLRITTNARDDSKTKENVTLDISTWLATQVWSTHISWIAFDHSLSTNAPFVPELGRNVLILIGRRPFKKNMPNYPLCEGSGPRQFVQQVQFPRVFEKPPMVLLALSGLDLLTNNDHCIKCEASQITDRSFAITVSTWGNANIWSASVSWIAIGDPNQVEQINPEEGRIPTTASNPTPVAPTLGKSQAVVDDDKLCKICFDRRVNTVIVPCGHIALCWDCGEKIKLDQRGNMTCPMCKSPFSDIIKTYAS